MSVTSFDVIDCPFGTMRYRNSGILPARKRSMFFMVVFPNVTAWPPPSSRDRSWPVLTARRSHA